MSERIPDTKTVSDTLNQPTQHVGWWRWGGPLLFARTEPKAAMTQPRVSQEQTE